MSNKRYTVSVQVEITEEDGTPFYSQGNQWSGLDYISMVGVEEKLVEAQSSIMEMGKLVASQMGKK